MTRSKYLRSEGGHLVLRLPDGTDLMLVGVQRMHFYRLAGATPEEATDEQVERYFARRAEEERTGQRVTPVVSSESAADMVSRELRILNLPQIMAGGEASAEVSIDQPPPAPPPPPRRPSGLGSAPRYRPGEGPALAGAPPPVPPLRAGEPSQSSGLGPAPRYRPGEASGSEGAPRSRFLRREGSALYLQAPDGSEQRVTQYTRVHFQRMLEVDIAQATDDEIEKWWKLQGSLEPGVTLPEAQSRNLLMEAVQAAGKLQRAELEMLHQTLTAWLAARREGEDR